MHLLVCTVYDVGMNVGILIVSVVDRRVQWLLLLRPLTLALEEVGDGGVWLVCNIGSKEGQRSPANANGGVGG